MKKVILIIAMVLLTAAVLQADVFIKKQTHSSAFEMMGQKQPATDTVEETWISKDKFAQISDKKSLVMDLAQKKFLMIMHGSKSYVEISLPISASKLLPPQIAGMMGNGKTDIKVAPTGETKTIGKWNCTGYTITINIQIMMPMTITQKIWASKDVPFDWKNYSQKIMPEIMRATMLQGKIDDQAINELKKIEGFVVASSMKMNVMGSDMSVETKVLEIVEKAAPQGIYSIPAGYEKKDFLNPGEMGK